MYLDSKVEETFRGWILSNLVEEVVTPKKILNIYIIVRSIVAVWGAHGCGNKRWTWTKSIAFSSEEAIKTANYYRNYAS